MMNTQIIVKKNHRNVDIEKPKIVLKKKLIKKPSKK